MGRKEVFVFAISLFIALFYLQLVNPAFGDYTGNSYSVSGSPKGVTNNGTYLWFTNGNGPGISQYWMNGTSTGFSFDSVGGGTGSEGITQNGTYFWIVDGTDDEVYQYWMNGTYTDISFNHSAGGGNAKPQGITQNGTYFWIVDGTDDEVYQYWMNGTYTGTSFDTAASGNSRPYGITQNGTYFWIVDNSGDEVYQYWMNGTYTGTSFDTSGEIFLPFGITQNGTYFWIIASLSDEEVYQYEMTDITKPQFTSLSPTNDTTSSDLAQTISVDLTDDTDLQSAELHVFNSTGDEITNIGRYTGESFDTSSGSFSKGITQNGTYFWTIDSSGIDEIDRYWMNGTSIGGFEPTSENAQPAGITQNGTYFWIGDGQDSQIYRYWINGTSTGTNFSTSGEILSSSNGVTTNSTYLWLVDGASNAQVHQYWINGTSTGFSFDTAGSGNANPIGITQNGTYFWITDNSDDEVYQYWMNGTYTDISFNHSAGGGDADPWGITQNGTYLWVVDRSDNKVYQYWQSFSNSVSGTSNSTSWNFNLSTGGTYTWYVNATDSAGNVNQSETKYITIDTTNPTINLNNPINNSNSSSSVTFSASCSDNLGPLSYCRLYGNWSGGWHANQTNTTSFNASQTNFTVNDIPEGKYVWSYFANDSAGNEVFGVNRTITVDATAPTISFTSPTPANNTLSNNGSEFVNINVTGTETNIDTIRIEFDGINYTLTENIGETGYFANYSNSSLTEGVYLYSVYINDTAGNSATTSERYYEVDTTAPTSFLHTSYSNGTIKRNTDVLTLNISVSDVTTSPDFCVVDVNGTNQTLSVSSGWCNNSNIELTGLSDGSRIINVYANDSAGNLVLNNSRYVVIDSTNPLTSYAPTTESSNSNFTRNWVFVNTSFIETNLLNVTFRIYNSTNTWNTTTYLTSSNSTNSSINFTNLQDAVYHYNYTVADDAGNQNTSSTRKIVLDNTIPPVNITSPSNGSSLSVDISVTSNDTISGTYYCEFNITRGSTTDFSTNNLTKSGNTFTNSSTLSVYATYTLNSNCFNYVGLQNSTTKNFTLTEPASEDSTSSSSGGGGGGGSVVTSTESTHTFTTLSPEKESSVSNFADESGVDEITFSVKEETSNVKVTHSYHDEKPTEVSKETGGKTYKYLEINVENLEDNLEKAVVKTKIPKEWFLENEIERDDTVLLKFDETSEEWSEIETIFVKEDDDYNYYESTLTSFSYFAISSRVVEPQELGETEDETSVPDVEEKEEMSKGEILFWVFIFILIILAMVLVVWVYNLVMSHRDDDIFQLDDYKSQNLKPYKKKYKKFSGGKRWQQ